ncbi:complement factor H-like [Entelurus aequoreus]|uniref:complement factor H-like n=1 Tax=Entelurus aequoreus TaxID=161455 RepID=UPI002B1D32D5|nr:complement factor H-like [Entelurus aequoreus]
MSLRCLVIVLLSFPQAFHAQVLAQSTAESCPAPRLDGGFFVPEQGTYSHRSGLAYACNHGWKPVVEGWWATTVCLNGSWSHMPQCIGENSCLPPDVPNAKYTQSAPGWYQEGQLIRVKCDQGYEHTTWEAIATCAKGTWSTLPVCQRSKSSCDEPPKMAHAVIVLHKYQQVFAADSEVHFECEEGYSVQGDNTRKSIFCFAGSWTQAPNCIRTQIVGHDSDMSGSVTKPAADTIPERGSGRGSPAGGSTVTDAGSATTSGSSSSSSSTPLKVPVDNCGAYPRLSNGDVVRKRDMSLKYACNSFYKRVGPEIVVCYDDGTWSKVPTCKEAFCEVDLDQYANYNIQESGTIILKDRESREVPCVWRYYTSRILCTQGSVSVTKCCHYQDHYYQRCS